MHGDLALVRREMCGWMTAVKGEECVILSAHLAFTHE